MTTIKLLESSLNKKPKFLTVDQCKVANFGEVSLEQEQLAVLSSINGQLVELCRTLPASIRDSAIITIQRYYTGFRLSNLLNFFTKFYAPSWSIIYWTQRANPVLSSEDLESAFCAQAIAYFLHMLDDHLADGQIPTSHLLLQLRTQGWMTFSQIAAKLGQQLPGGNELVQQLIDIYFSSIQSSKDVNGIDAYCEIFRKQMSTTLVIPMLVAQKTGCDPIAIRQAYECFGIAWRLLDDLRDCSVDAISGEMSGIYHILPPKFQNLWLLCSRKNEDTDEWKQLQFYLEQEQILPQFISLIVMKLREAENAARLAGLDGYANQLHQLATPLKNDSI
ncbi:hypothetical protein G7B40_001215 [Aetokthonos hydrillicola Thurmond2011]|jgi:hypothetical protein|uniref:Uncharacterized protein n=1 Tax=Aetokthonos hydrillicola Thurmond2011 TaxID=2712845 RepID=A0AAP5I667_9CYAN|nr:hypothetical protein [Aetokthonos hydrillicola]MBO3462887.1 hypothetical protein [Aetokthonos hydrillicola CCALA 1050]MBW4589602.1 hypothetical protein [Aetokthonos hydrillicola CCALA 1050]MDR9893205.1 hypothetical protein [Aetokthonos hydrillicola Thurmond2011]